MIVTNNNVVYARNTEVKIVDNEEARNFENKYHLQGSIDSKINLGLYKDNKLIYLMTFGKPRFSNSYEYEILRMCSSHKVIGGAEKLFKYFLNNFNPTSIVTYSDFSKFRGNVYKKLGFKFKELTAPGYIWYNIYIIKILLLDIKILKAV